MAITKIIDIKHLTDYTTISLHGKLKTSHSTKEEVKLRTGCKLMKLDCVIADHTDVIKITLWDNQISAVEDRKTYKIEKGKVRTFQGEKYVTLNEDSVITLTKKEMSVVPEFSQVIEEEKSLIVTEIDGVDSLQRYARCQSCK